MKSILLILLFFLGFAGCAKQEDNLSAIPLIEGASAVEKVPREEEGYYQLHFEVARKYPDTDVIAFYKNYFKNNSWTPVCPDAYQWGKGVSGSQAPSKNYPVKSLVQVMSKEEERKIIFILVIHKGKELEDGSVSWDEERQHVTVSLSELKDKNEYERILSISKEICASNSNSEL